MPATLSRMTGQRIVSRVLLSVIALIVLVVGGAWVYATFINDAPDEFGTADLEARLTESTLPISESTLPQDSAVTESTQSNEESIEDDDEVATTTSSDSAAGQWVIADGSEVGYRVAEVLFGIDTEGVGRTKLVNGSITLQETSIIDAEFTVDVASMRSDDSRRDGQFRGRIMETDEFPTASFILSEPIDLGVTATEGASITTTLSGELTMHGVTNPVVVDISAKIENGRLGVVGSIPVVFTDYEIVDPSITAIKVEPQGLIEFVLIFSPA